MKKRAEQPRKRSDPAAIRKQQREIARDVVKRSLPRPIDTASTPKPVPPAGRVLNPRRKRNPIIKGGLVTGRKAPNTI